MRLGTGERIRKNEDVKSKDCAGSCRRPKCVETIIGIHLFSVPALEAGGRSVPLPPDKPEGGSEQQEDHPTTTWCPLFEVLQA